MSLEPDYESFIGLNLLEGLDLSHNNLASMPAGLFCPLVNIVKVNVSHNILVDLEHLGVNFTIILQTALLVQKCITHIGLISSTFYEHL